MENRIEENLNQLRNSHSEIKKMLMEMLDSRQAEMTNHLYEERAKLEEERKTLTGTLAKLETMTQAKIRVLEREADDFLAAGDFGKAEQKKAEAEEAKNTLEKAKARKAAITDRLEVISREILTASKNALDGVYYDIVRAALSSVESHINFMESLWSDLLQYGNQYSITLSSNYKNRLVPTDHGDMRVLFRKMQNWI